MTGPRSVLITGGAQGLGRATAELFAERGYRVVIADLDGEAAAGCAADLGDGHLGLHCDVTDEASVAALADEAGSIGVLVNNAGIGDSSLPTTEQTLENFRRVSAVHLDGTFLMSRAFGAKMIEAGGGAIVNLSSMAGQVGLSRRNAYGAAKAGIASMTRSMAVEWGRQGVRVNAVAPGYAATALVLKLHDEGLIDLDAIRRATPMGKLVEPRDVAEAVWFLASPAAGAITGTVLNVDCGWVAFGEYASLLQATE